MPTLVFADTPSLRAALDAGLVPPAVQAQPLRFARDPAGALWVEPSGKLSRSDQDKLSAAGVSLKRNKPESVGETREVGCWGEILPAAPAGEPAPPLGEVLFVSEGDEGFLRLSGELIRLGCEDQRLAFFVDGSGRRRNLCRVIDPPYYAVLRALDPDDPLRAYAPTRLGGRVMVELGFRHPIADRFAAEPGQLILVPGSADAGAWLRVPDGPWLDLHEVAQVALPEPSDWTASKPARRLQIELKLVRAPAQRPPTLWVVRERAIEQMETLVRTLPDVVVARLRFAAVTLANGETMVVLRARRSEQQPPALELAAEAYTTVAQLPDLHVPVARTIDPPLRPAKLRELLLRESERVVWLAPRAGDERRGQAFVRESLPERAFAPLADWVDYLVGQHVDELIPWIRSTSFDLDEFVSMQLEWDERPSGREPRDDDDERRRGRKRASQAPREQPSAVEVVRVASETESAAPLVTPVELAPIELPRNEVEQRLGALEQSMCELGSPLDDPGRTPMWVDLGGLQARLHRSRDAGLSWARALWEPGPPGGLGPLAIAERWAKAEAQMLGYPDPDGLFGILDVVPEDLDEPMIRALAARVVVEQLRSKAAPADAPRSLAGDRLAALQRFFASQGNQLDLRTAWLVRSALAQLAGDDRLALFQTRDAIMAALREGMGLSRNVPAFIRTHGSEGDAGDLGRLADELLRIRDEFLTTKRRRSTIESTYPEDMTRAYVRLTFGWGLARVGRPEPARAELDAARNLLGARLDEVRPGASDKAGNQLHRAAFLAYQARIEQSLEGMPASTPLSPAPGGPIAAREALISLDRFKYDRLIQLSRILDPRQAVDAFERWTHKEDEPFAGLALLTQPEQLARLFDQMLAALAGVGPQKRTRDLGDMLAFLEALPDTLAVPLLRRVLEQVATLPIADQPRLLRDTILVAAHYDRPELLGEALTLIEASHTALAEAQPIAHAELLTRCAPALRRSGLDERLGRLLGQLEAKIGDAGDLAHVTARLHLAAGHAVLGQPERVQPAFVAAHALLPELNPGDHQVLLREIAVALSRSTPGQAIAGARALMQRLPDTTDSMSTNTHFCLAVIQLMEAVVLSLASEDLALSEWARRWIEEDEHLLHRRIHRDLARVG
ncbi:hypothetical protein ACNOYE_30525 [Nannocystaceae bacterium ST9]